MKVPGYPYSESGEFYRHRPGASHEQLTAAAWVAAKTKQHPAGAGGDGGAASAGGARRQDAGDDRRAVGRAAGRRHRRRLAEGGVRRGRAPRRLPSAARSPTNTCDAFRALWTEERPEFHGKYATFDGLLLEPKPVQKPHPPIWVGGESGPSLRRAARLGDAWYPIGSNRRICWTPLPRLRAGIARLRRATAEAGRDPAALRLCIG